jgi:hypothetical protein
MYALDQYLQSLQEDNIGKATNFTLIINDLLHHGSIIYGNAKYNCPFSFAQKHQLDEFLDLFKEIQDRRIQKISMYYQQQQLGYGKTEADAMSKKIISAHSDLMSLSDQARNELIVKNLYSHWLDK